MFWTARTSEDNNNDYDFDLASGEKQTGRRRYIIPGAEV